MVKKIVLLAAVLQILGCKGADTDPKGGICGTTYIPLYHVTVTKPAENSGREVTCIAMDDQPYFFVFGEECEIKYHFHEGDKTKADISAKIKGFEKVTLYNVANNSNMDVCDAANLSDFTTYIDINLTR
jgi:hypothetical protein